MKWFRFDIRILIALVVVAALGWFIFGNYIEIGNPVIKLDSDVKAIGRQKTVGITFSDSKSGLSRITAEIIQDNKGHVLADKKIPQKGVAHESLSLNIASTQLALHDGPAVLKISATDHSLLKNQTVLSQSVTIDTIPPMINLLKNINYINHHAMTARTVGCQRVQLAQLHIIITTFQKNRHINAIVTAVG